MRRLAALLKWVARGVLAAAAAVEVYILLFPAVTAPYGIGAGIFAVGAASWLLWLGTRTVAYLVYGD